MTDATEVDFGLSDVLVFSPENDIFILVVVSAFSLLGINHYLSLSLKVNIHKIPGLFLYDDLFPTQLRGKGPNGSETTITVCPKLGSEVISDFDQNTVKYIIIFNEVSQFVDLICGVDYDTRARSLLLLHISSGI